MAGVIYRTTYSDIVGDDWQIDIYDTDYSGSVKTFETQGAGVRFERTATLQNRTAPILGTLATVTAISQDSTFNNMINSMVTADEDRYFLKVYKNSSAYWYGVLLFDMYEADDIFYPQPTTLTFTDGLGRLKGIDYNNDGTAYTGSDTLIGHMWKILNKVPTLQFWTGSDICLKTSLHYWEESMNYSASTDPSPLIRIPHEAFYTIKKNGDYKYKNCYEVLETIVQSFYGRFWLDDGAWHWAQVDEFRNNSITFFNYEKDGTSSVSSGSISPRLTEGTTVKRYQGGFQSYAGLRRVVAQYEHNSSGNFINQPIVLNAAARDIGNVGDNGGDARFLFNVSFKLNFINTTGNTLKARFHLKVKHNNRYLKRDATSSADNNNYLFQWSTDSTNTVQFWTPSIPSTAGQNQEVTIHASFATPYLATNGNVEMELTLATATDVFLINGTSSTITITPTGEMSGYVEYKTDDAAENIRTFTADNDNQGNFSEVMELPVACFGDQFNSGTKNALEVYDGSGWVRSNGWKRRNAGTAVTFHKLLLNDILAGQRTAVRKYIGTVRGLTASAGFLNTLSFDGKIWCPLSGTYDTQKATWRGEWFVIDFDNSSIVITDAGEDVGVGVGVVPPSSDGNFGSGVNIDGAAELTASTLDLNDGNDNTSIGGGGGVIGGSDNINIGGGLGSGTSGTGNTVIGADSFSNNTGDFNTGIGSNAGVTNTSGNYNTFIGREAGYSNTSGSHNHFLGYQSGYSNTSGTYNTFIGWEAGYSNTTGNYNFFVGRQSGYSNQNGTYNIFFGYQSGYSNTSGGHNNFFGYQSGRMNTTGNYNNFLGWKAGYSNTSGGHNNFLGWTSGYSNTIGNHNHFLGFQSGYSNTSGNYNQFIGWAAGYSNTNGNYNFFVGRDAGYSNTGGDYNAFLGYRTGYSNTSGSYNVFLGREAGRSNETGNYNFFVGRDAGRANTTGSHSIIIGWDAGKVNTIGGHNYFLGYQSGYSNTTGNYNQFIGWAAGYSNTTGSYNFFVGRDAGKNNTTGSNNIVIGYNAQTGNYSNVIVLGEGATATANNSLVIGSSADAIGNVTAETITADYTMTVYINGSTFKIPLERQ